MGKYQGCTINFMKPGLLLILAILACVARGRDRKRGRIQPPPNLHVIL
jgi:hypothetical protein